MVTLRDIASKASVSQTTVSKVLNNKYREVGITSDCAARVREIASQLGYRPNRAARATASGRFNTIGILKVNGPVGLGQLPDGLLNGIEAGAERRGLQLSFSSINPDFETTGRLPKVFRESWADGFLLIGDWAPTAQLAEQARGMNIPIVTLGVASGHDSVIADEAGAARQAVECLLGAGHRRIGYVPCDHLPASVRQLRTEAFFKAMSGEGLDGRVVELPAERRRMEVVDWEGRAAARRAFLASADRPKALVVDSVELAYPLLAEARAMGLRLPEDLSLVTFHDVVASGLGLCINTLVLRCSEMGQSAVDLLHRRIAKGKPQPSVSIAYEYFGGHTV